MGGAWPRVLLAPSPRCWSPLSLRPLRHARGDFRTNVANAGRPRGMVWKHKQVPDRCR